MRRLTADEASWQAFEERHRKPEMKTPVIDELRLVNTSPIGDDVILTHLGIEPGDALDDMALRAKLLSLYSLAYFDVIHDRLERADGRNVLVVETPARPHGRNLAQIGIKFIDDFEGDSGYALTVRHQFLAVNRRGGEWQNVLQIGDRALATSSLYQPLDRAMRWFVEPSLGYRRFHQSIWVDGGPVAVTLGVAGLCNICPGIHAPPGHRPHL